MPTFVFFDQQEWFEAATEWWCFINPETVLDSNCNKFPARAEADRLHLAFEVEMSYDELTQQIVDNRVTLIVDCNDYITEGIYGQVFDVVPTLELQHCCNVVLEVDLLDAVANRRVE